MTETNDDERELDEDAAIVRVKAAQASAIERIAQLVPGQVLELRDVIDKRSWGPGPWQDEPDLVAWRLAEDPDYWCQIARNAGLSGALMGYVAVPAGHPLHGQDYGMLDRRLETHGGFTFSGEAVGGRWVFGFDCGHGWDYQPAMEAAMRGSDSFLPPHLRTHMFHEPMFGKHNYRHLAYVKVIVELLAEQLLYIGRGLAIGICRLCGCTDEDCRACIEITGEPCRWVKPDLCSRCAPQLEVAR